MAKLQRGQAANPGAGLDRKSKGKVRMFSKRSLVGSGAALLALIVAMALAACGDSSDSERTDLSAVMVIFDPRTEDAYREAFVDPIADTGINVTFDSPTAYPKLEAQVKSQNVTWTVIESDPWWAIANCEKMIEPIDIKVEGLAENEFDSGDCGLPGNTFAFTYSYDEDQFGDDPPQGWDDFFDTDKYPGKRAVWGSYAVNGILEGALLADGVAPDDLYPLDLDRAFAKLDTIRGSLSFYDTLGQAQQTMQSKGAAMVLATNIPGYGQAISGGTFKPVWDQTILSWDAYIVPKGANREAADLLLEQIAKPEGQEILAAGTGFGVVSPDAKPEFDENLQTWSPSGEIDGVANDSTAVHMDQRYYSEHFNEVSRRWTQWVSG